LGLFSLASALYKKAGGAVKPIIPAKLQKFGKNLVGAKKL
jgi:hypothetical protein